MVIRFLLVLLEFLFMKNKIASMAARYARCVHYTAIWVTTGALNVPNTWHWQHLSFFPFFSQQLPHNLQPVRLEPQFS